MGNRKRFKHTIIWNIFRRSMENILQILVVLFIKHQIILNKKRLGTFFMCSNEWYNGLGEKTQMHHQPKLIQLHQQPNFSISKSDA